MNTYLIIFRLSANEDLYTNMIAYLKTSIYWARPMSGVWLIKTSNTVAGIRDGVKSRVNSSDIVFVVDVTKKDWATSNIEKIVSDWMKENV